MLKPISLLVGALALPTFSAAKADTNKTVSILTLMETGKPSVSIDLSDATKPNVQRITISSDLTTYDANPKGLTQTTVFKDNVAVVLTDKMGKRTDYKVKDGLAVLTVTSVKATPQPKLKVAPKPKA